MMSDMTLRYYLVKHFDNQTAGRLITHSGVIMHSSQQCAARHVLGGATISKPVPRYNGSLDGLLTPHLDGTIFSDSRIAETTNLHAGEMPLQHCRQSSRPASKMSIPRAVVSSLSQYPGSLCRHARCRGYTGRGNQSASSVLCSCVVW